MMDVDPAILEAPYYEEVIVDGEVKTTSSLLGVYDGMYAYLSESIESMQTVNNQGIEKVNLVLYSRKSCPYCQRVLSYLRSIHKTIPIKDIGSNPQYAEELIQIGSKRQVPCLVINGKALYESSDIIEWLKSNQDLY